ncbi:MAG: hypothetical protein WC665_04075 [Sulfurimonas sp.]|jgi:hypothetical protein
MQKWCGIFKPKKFVATKLPTHYLTKTSTEQERQFMKQLSSSTEKSSVVVYALELDDSLAGLIGLSASQVDSISTIQIDYLYVSSEHRKSIFEELANTKISTYLIDLAIVLTKKISSEIGVRWLPLVPDNDKLEEFYTKEFGFKPHNDRDKQRYLFLKI